MVRPGPSSAIAIGTCVWLMSSSAAAQGANEAAAETLFEEGKKLMAAGDYARACPKLAESQRLDPGAGTLLNLGACHEKAGRTATAWVTYRETIAVAEKTNRREWAAQAQKRAKALEPMLSKITIVVPANARVVGLVVRRDGAQIGDAELGLAIPQDPGTHVIEATAPGKKAFSTSVDLGTQADAKIVNVTLSDEGAAVPTQPPAPSTTSPSDDTRPSDGGSVRIVGLAAAGAGLVGIGVGTFFGLRASSLDEDSKPNCNADQSLCNAEGLDQVNRAKTAATISTVGFVAGGALLIGGAVLFFTAPKSEAKSAKRTVVVPVADANGGGLFVSGAF